MPKRFPQNMLFVAEAAPKPSTKPLSIPMVIQAIMPVISVYASRKRPRCMPVTPLTTRITPIHSSQATK